MPLTAMLATILAAVTTTMDTVLPLKKVLPSTKRCKSAYVAAHRTYHSAIKEAKASHWHAFLDTLTDWTVFKAASYATDAITSPSTIPLLRRANGTLMNDQAEMVELLFQGTSAPMIPCNL
ncbi:hypothetical protein CROQUDRAFT_99565 [Cronartium quercuum f. sp. fusiforme G11]|uniref:Uncharacterized protein n=1 Tax=Cronartium quercuum f. sp. fusiforme G11 TaxID=708437 RepID=A0A9P6N6T6_9BASI|nr:hypothetical protein CROQUDRAFT_99565 [Cronartium quercuum f. sp. fusiforme G11]